MAQERAEIEAKGDHLNDAISKSEIEIKKLDNTLKHLNSKNTVTSFLVSLT